MEVLAIILGIGGFLIMMTMSEENSFLRWFGLIIFLWGMALGIVTDKLKQNTPEYKLQQLKYEIDEIHADSMNIHKENQRKLWIWKRTKELEDSLKVLKKY